MRLMSWTLIMKLGWLVQWLIHFQMYSGLWFDGLYPIFRKFIIKKFIIFSNYSISVLFKFIINHIIINMLKLIRTTIIAPRFSLLPFSIAPSLGYHFSSDQKSLNVILNSLKISMNGQQKNLMESGLIQDQKYDV